MNYHAVNFAAPQGGIHDFDFLHGDWRIDNKRLKRHWAGGDDWENFESYSHCQPYLGGGANIEQMTVPSRNVSGLMLRCFDSVTRRWVLYAIDSLNGMLPPPLYGGFLGDHGVFIGRCTDDGLPVTVQIFWTRLDADNARWSQAFSRDGIIWETNWVMRLSRA